MDQSLNLVLVLVEEWLDNLIVDNLRALGLGSKEVDEEDELDPEVVWDHVKEASGEVVQEGENAENDPVGQPLLVVVGALSLECLDALGSRVENSDGESQNGGAKDANSNE